LKLNHYTGETMGYTIYRTTQEAGEHAIFLKRIANLMNHYG